VWLGDHDGATIDQILAVFVGGKTFDLHNTRRMRWQKQFAGGEEVIEGETRRK